MNFEIVKHESSIGSIYLIPSLLGEDAEDCFTAAVKEKIFDIEFFIVENERSARRFLRRIGYKKNFDEVKMMKAETDKEFLADESLLSYLSEGKNIGVISEAGAPGIADPGAAVVRWAHQHLIKAIPLIGPASIFLALMASGLNGQQFCFHGYLPVQSNERRKKISQLEEESHRKNQTQIFMETPYRNESLLKDLLETLKFATLLCIAANITLSDEFILTQSISSWKNEIPDLKKKPTIFLILAQ